MDDHKVRGSYVAATYTFAQRNYSSEQVETILEQLSPDVRDALPGIKSTDWYPLHFATEQLRGIYQAHSDPKIAIETIERCGRFIGDEASTTFLRLLMKVLTLPMMASKWQQFWLRYHNFGICTADASQIQEKKFLVVSNMGYPYVHGIGSGWIQNVLASLGKQNVKVETNVPLGQVEMPEIRWTATWV
jgi:hypothetical protein